MWEVPSRVIRLAIAVLNNMTRVFVFGVGALVVPSFVFAQTLFQVAGILNIFVGLMATAAVLTFAAGLGYYFARLGLDSRKVGLHIMEWGVALVFVLIVLLALVRFVRLYTETVLAVISFGVLIFVIIALIHFAAVGGGKAAGGGKKEEHNKPR